MSCAFLPISPLPSRRPLSHPLPRVSALPRASAGSGGGRSPWPLPRFVQTLVRYSPVTRFFQPPATDPAAMLRARRARAVARAAPSSNRRRVVLVTGANGGAGRRVVRDLVDSGVAVRAMTRSREKLQAALQTVGVSVDAVDVVVSDLYNVRPEFFKDVVAVVSCTGVNVGPADDPDRSKYFQGVKFYEPRVLDDTPENVEYVGVRNLIEAAQRGYRGEEGEEGEGAEEELVMGFDDEVAVRAQWGALDDVVMGGVSESAAKVRGGNLLYEGVVSTDNRGGFASLRTVSFKEPLDLGGFEGFVMRVKGDGQSFKLIVRDEDKWDGISHCFTFATDKGKWREVRVPFSAFNTVFRAKTLPEGNPLDPRKVFAFQIMLSKFEYDGELNQSFQPGAFRLEIESIRAYKAGGTEAPRVVYIGSAGVTRVLRKDEFDLEQQPPAVRMNEMLGRLLDWKLAGEDVIRGSGLPYTILRPCALTEKEAVGMDKLVLRQGDTMTGQVSREDLAALIVKVMGDERFENVTVEVAAGEGNGLDMEAERLEKDEVKARTFAQFPYVPAAVAKN